MAPTFFATQAQFRAWLEKHHKKETELLVGFYKVSSNKPSMTFSQSVDQTLWTRWIMTAKPEKTRLSRLEKTIQISEQEKRMC